MKKTHIVDGKREWVSEPEDIQIAYLRGDTNLVRDWVKELLVGELGFEEFIFDSYRLEHNGVSLQIGWDEDVLKICTDEEDSKVHHIPLLLKRLRAEWQAEVRRSKRG
jgi:hypothetical protein